MKINLPLFVFMLLTKLSFGQQKSLLISTHLNTKAGKAVEKVSVVVDKVGTCITGNDGKCFYPTLRGIGMSVNIKASLSDYVPINNLELKSYRLSDQKIDTVRVIMSLIAEREKYALAYFEKETGIIIRKRFEEKEKSLYAQIKDLVAKMNDIKDKNNLAYQKLEKNLEEANKRLELVQKDKLNQESIAQRLATTLSMLEGEEIPDYVSQAYSLFRQGKIKEADKVLQIDAIDNEVVKAKLMIKIGELGKKILQNAIASYLFKAQLKIELNEYKQAEILFEKAYQADSNNANTLYQYAYFLQKQNRAKRPAELYERALMIREALAKDNPQQYLPYVANTLNNLGIFYSDNNLKEQAQKAYERALMIYEALAKDN
ncbi:tetratricopeptide repeat protein, partial [Arcicella rigui]